MNHLNRSLTFILLCCLLLAGCAPQAPSARPTSLPTGDSPTKLPIATPLPLTTDAPTPLPTASPTPEPTETPLPPTDTPVPTAPQPVVKQGLIAFVMFYQGGYGGIHVIQADGSSDPLMLSLHPSLDTRPSWSPDGSKIAFESRRDDPFAEDHMAIFIMNSDGTQLTRLTNSDGWYAQADWSPDGSRIAFLAAESKVSGDADLAVLDLNTRELTRLTEGPGIDMEPSWSPDASQIAFASDRAGSLNIYTLNVNTGETTQLTQESGDNNHPDWSPDGKKILFVSTRDGDEEIYVMDSDGANPTRLTSTPGRDIDPEWSPDGNYFAFGHENSGIRSIYISDLNGSPPELLFELSAEAGSGHPAWTMAAETIPEGPVFGPPFCVRDTDSDGQPDTVSTTFSTEDNMAFIGFPYDQMQDGMEFWNRVIMKGDVDFSMDNYPGPWDGGEEGTHFTYAMLQHTPGSIKVELYLGEQLMQEIECEIVEP